MQRSLLLFATLVVVLCHALESESRFEEDNTDVGMIDSPQNIRIDIDSDASWQGTDEMQQKLLRRQEYGEGNMEWKNLLVKPQSTIGSMLAYHSGEMLRRLVGSNCVLIERGTVTKYFMCVGCEVQEAMGCVDDMRNNKSGNVRSTCKFDHVMEGNMAKAMEQEQQEACCPTVEGGSLKYFAGSAYPEAFRCISNVGCTESTINSQLMEECHGLCDYIPSTGDDASVASYRDGTICLADYAAAPRAVSLSIASVIAIVVTGAIVTIL